MGCLRNYRFYSDPQVKLFDGDAFEVAKHMDDGVADCIVTSPPYFGLRDYGIEGQYGLEKSPAEYVETMRRLFSELRRVLADDGTLWLNIGDSYSRTGGGGNGSSDGKVGRNGAKKSPPSYSRLSGEAFIAGSDFEPTGRPATKASFLPEKNLLGVPWRVAFALQDDGWILRNAIIWNKPNAMPESVTDRLSGRYEMVFMFSKSRRYWFDLDPIREAGGGHAGKSWDERKANGAAMERKLNPDAPGYSQFATPELGRNPGDVWSINTQPFSAAHFAVMPITLAQRCIVAGCKPGGTVLDPFSGSGTTGLAAQRTGRKYIGIDLNRDYLELSLKTRLQNAALDFGEDT
jgi:site-specific DNA-methyltransferase (cytosine-N4-specific)